MWKTTLTLTLKLQIIFNILGKGQLSFINCFGGDESGLSTETHTSAHSWEHTWWWTSFTAAWISKGCFPGDAAICTQGGDETPAYARSAERSLPNPALRRFAKLQRAQMEPALVLRPALIIKPPLPTYVRSSFTCQTTALSKYQQTGSRPCSVWFAQDHTGSLWPSWKLSPRLPAPGWGLGSGLGAILGPFPMQCGANAGRETWVWQKHLACTYLNPAQWWDALAAGGQRDLRTPRRAWRGLGPMKRSGKILPGSGGFWFIFSPRACLFYSCCWQGEGYLICAEGQMLSTVEQCLQEARLLLRCKPSDGHKMAYRGAGGKEID